MTAPHATEMLRTSAIRVALSATAVVAVAYLVIAFGVLAIFTQNQTNQIDGRLVGSLQHMDQQPPLGQGSFEGPGPDRPGGLPFLSWAVQPDGSVRADLSNPFNLPTSLQHVSSPVTATIDGVELRLAGAQVGDDWRVVAQSLDPLNQARGTIVLAELLIAPVLFLVVFLGAVAIGRRVAAPIEAARRRQLEFTADASHELRTPLSVIEAETTLALTRDREAAWYRSAFGRVGRESKRMARLLDDMLWLARFDATRGVPNAEQVDLGVLASEAANRFGSVAEARHLALSLSIAPGSHVVTGPPEWLDRLLGVLLDNACKYAGDGGSVHVSVAREGDRVRLTVDDSGPGIAAEERARIFDRFHRATDSTSGAGLGLAIGDAIVRATGGRWRIGASPAGGASMSVSWPPGMSGPRVVESRERTSEPASPG